MTRAALPGLAVAALLAVPATVLGTALPVVGGPVMAMAVGVPAGWALRRCAPGVWHRCQPGLRAAGRHALQAALVVTGFGLPFAEVVRIGWAALPVMLGTLLVALLGTWLLGRSMRLHPETSLLIGVGTGICGASAIAAVTSVLRPAQDRVAYAIGTIFTFNIAAVLLYPALGRLLGLSDASFGLWAGTAINDTSSVVAAAETFGAAAGAYAIVVKLARSLAIVPVCLAVQLWRTRREATRHSGGNQRHAAAVLRVFPLFILGFLAASAVASAGVIPGSYQPGIRCVSTFLISVALAGIGVTLDFGRMRAAGLRPLAFGGALSAAIGVTSLGIQALTGV